MDPVTEIAGLLHACHDTDGLAAYPEHKCLQSRYIPPTKDAETTAILSVKASLKYEAVSHRLREGSIRTQAMSFL